MNARNNSRGYQKITTAVEALHVDFRDRVALDIGSSTGGFTEYAIEHGAKQVIAIEKGTNQMSAPLRFDPRVELHEKTDIFSVTARHPKNAKLLISVPDLILADVSFVSLTKILAYAASALSTRDTRFLVMLKPQFEASPAQLTRGVVKNSKIRREIIKNFEIWLKTHAFHIIRKSDNHLPGRTGNLERFYYLSRE